MTTWKIEEKEIEKFLEDWKQGVLKNIKGRDLLVSNSVHGTFWSPSNKHKCFRTAGFALSKDCLKDESISPFMSSIPFAFYFIEKGKMTSNQE